MPLLTIFQRIWDLVKLRYLKQFNQADFLKTISKTIGNLGKKGNDKLFL